MIYTRAHLEALDRSDPLARFRDAFSLPPGVIYLDGNSLGAMPKATPARVARVVNEEWGKSLIRGWTDHQWIDLQHRIGDKIGRLIGARPGETLAADSTSINLFKLLSAALHARPGRSVILSETGNFPTDLYIAEGLVNLLGKDRQLVTVPSEDLLDHLDSSVAVVMLTHVNYRSGLMHDMARITKAAHAVGALVLWDLAHSAGAMPIDLTAIDADLAVGCGYKYLNGGPGAPAFLYINKRLQPDFQPALSGWLGHDAPFAFEPSYRPAPGISRGIVGTPPILSLAALEIGVDLLLEAPMAAIRDKSCRQGEIFAALVRQELGAYGFTIISPQDATLRGSQVSLSHPNGWPIMQALIAHGVIGDYRAPNVLRFGFTPLYLGYSELWDVIAILKQVMNEAVWERTEYQRLAKVT